MQAEDRPEVQMTSCFFFCQVLQCSANVVS